MIVNRVGFESLVKREMVRTFSIINQVIWPPFIQTLLYVFVFGLAIGSRIPSVQGVSYSQFLIPGLIMLQVIDQTYSEGRACVPGPFMNWIQNPSAASAFGRLRVAGVLRASSSRSDRVPRVVLVHAAPTNWWFFFTVTIVATLFSRSIVADLGRKLTTRLDDDVLHQPLVCRRVFTRRSPAWSAISLFNRCST